VFNDSITLQKMANVAQIPIIDLSAPDQRQVARDLVEAAVEHGFIYIKNHGKDIPIETINQSFQLVLPLPDSLHHPLFANPANPQSKDLFASPTAEKEECKVQTKTFKGWLGMHVETLDPKHQRVCTPR
jgi:isopenicillin N synthase-like dioxygenase